MQRSARLVDLTERLIYLRSIPVAATLPMPVLRLIAAALTARTYPAGALLMKQGEPIDSLQFLIQGKVALARNGRSLGHLSPPQSLGFLGILARADGTYDATAEVETETLELEAEPLYELFEEHFSLLHASLRYAAERLCSDMQELPAEALAIPFDEHVGAVPDRPLDLVERIFFLRRVSAFSKASLSALAVVAEQLVEVRVAASGEALWRPGDRSEHALMIVDGVVECATADGQKRFRYGPGTAVGGVEALANKPRWYGVTTAGPLVALRGRTDDLLDVFEDHYPMAMDFVAMLASGIIAPHGAQGGAGRAGAGKRCATCPAWARSSWAPEAGRFSQASPSPSAASCARAMAAARAARASSPASRARQAAREAAVTMSSSQSPVRARISSAAAQCASKLVHARAEARQGMSATWAKAR